MAKSKKINIKKVLKAKRVFLTKMLEIPVFVKKEEKTKIPLRLLVERPTLRLKANIENSKENTNDISLESTAITELAPTPTPTPTPSPTPVIVPVFKFDNKNHRATQQRKQLMAPGLVNKTSPITPRTVSMRYDNNDGNIKQMVLNREVFNRFELIHGFPLNHNNKSTSLGNGFVFATCNHHEYSYFINNAFNKLCTQGAGAEIEIFVSQLIENFKKSINDKEVLPSFKITQIDFFYKALNNWLIKPNQKQIKQRFINRLKTFLGFVDDCLDFYTTTIRKNNEHVAEQQKKALLEKNKQELLKKQIANINNPDTRNQKPNLHIKENARFIYRSKINNTAKLLPSMQKSGEKLQLATKNKKGQIELLMGLDFGTSSTKVVVSNNAAERSYGIEFTTAANYQSYLLPTTLYQTEGRFSLEKGQEEHRNLKLQFLDNPYKVDNKIYIVAYLALVMARSRAYLFKNHEAELKGSEFLWQINAGFASIDLDSLPSAAIYKRLIYIAWSFSIRTSSITKKNILKELDETPANADLFEYFSDFSPVYVEVQPEITAQIYAFLNSTQFDPRARNHYMIVDVGAGTVDTAVFNVKQKNGNWNFSFFNANVERNGTVALHQKRIAWWKKQLIDYQANAQLITDLENLPLGTENIHLFPECYLDYFDGIDNLDHNYNGFEKIDFNPDHYFYNHHIKIQVVSKTLFQVHREHQLSTNEIKNIPFFLCGGGSRMQLYKNIIQELKTPPPSTSWLCSQYKELTKPEKLNAINLEQENYDRLSVAYGLCNMPLGDVVQAKPLVPVRQFKAPSYKYIGKDDV